MKSLTKIQSLRPNKVPNQINNYNRRAKNFNSSSKCRNQSQNTLNIRYQFGQSIPMP